MVLFLDDAENILSDIAVAENNYQKALFTDFSEEDLLLHRKLDDKLKRNIRKIL